MKEINIFDIHAHIFPEKIAEKAVDSISRFYDIRMNGKGTVQDLLTSDRRRGIRRCVVHSTATKVEQVASINDFIAGTVGRHPELIGFGTLHPELDDPRGELARMKSMGLKGVKLHPDFQEFNIDDERMFRTYELLEGGLPVLVHMGDRTRPFSKPVRLARVLDRFPGLIVIAAHLGGYSAWDEAEEYLVGRDLFLDTSSSLWKLEPARAASIMRRHGIDRILFGTDYPMWNCDEELERLDRLGLTGEERSAVLWDNACRLLGCK